MLRHTRAGLAPTGELERTHGFRLELSYLGCKASNPPPPHLPLLETSQKKKKRWMKKHEIITNICSTPEPLKKRTKPQKERKKNVSTISSSAIWHLKCKKREENKRHFCQIVLKIFDAKNKLVLNKQQKTVSCVNSSSVPRGLEVMFKTSHVLLTCQHHLISKLCLDPLNRRKGIVYHGCKAQSRNDIFIRQERENETRTYMYVYVPFY